MFPMRRTGRGSDPGERAFHGGGGSTTSLRFQELTDGTGKDVLLLR